MITKEDRFQPQALLTIYRSHQQGEEKLYVEASPILPNGEVGAAIPLSEEAAAELGEALYKSSTKPVGGQIPANLLSIEWENNKPTLIWYTSAQRQKLVYTKELNIPNGIVHVPALLWIWNSNEGKLSLYALDSDQRPDNKSKLYNAPFHNVYEDNSTCIGTGSRHIEKHQTFKAIMDNVMLVWWKTAFSAVHNEKACKLNLNTLHHSLVTTRKNFPIDQLVLSKTKIKI